MLGVTRFLGIVVLAGRLDPEFDIKRVCIKIPSTWEGLQACRQLKSINIKTLATTLFSIEQAALAGEVGCQYIAPYVNELKSQVDTEWVIVHHWASRLKNSLFSQISRSQSCTRLMCDCSKILWVSFNIDESSSSKFQIYPRNYGACWGASYDYFTPSSQRARYNEAWSYEFSRSVV